MTGESSEWPDSTPFAGGDPLTWLVRGKLRVNILFAAIGVVLLLALPVVAIAFANDLWAGSPEMNGILSDPSFWFLNLIAYPATVFFFLWMPDGVWGVLVGLHDNGAIGERTAGLQGFVEAFRKAYTWWLWAAISFAAVLAVTVFFLVPYLRGINLWWTSGEAIFWYSNLVYAFYYTLIGLIVLRILMAIVWFNRLFRRFDVRVKVLHPDKAGGLSPLGVFSVKIGYLTGVYGMTLVVISLSTNYLTTGRVYPNLDLPFVVAVLLYLVLAPVAFFAPIGSAHAAMARARHDFALKLSEHFDAEFAALEASLDLEGKVIRKNLDRIQRLQELHALTSGFPVWPFNVESMVRFITSILSPVLVIVITVLIERALQ